MDRNHALLQTLQLSTPMLDRLCNIARDTGALGAKLTGGGGGGCMIALAQDHTAAQRIEQALGKHAPMAFTVQIRA
jgi:mevalonate kinase